MPVTPHDRAGQPRDAEAATVADLRPGAQRKLAGSAASHGVKRRKAARSVSVMARARTDGTPAQKMNLVAVAKRSARPIFKAYIGAMNATKGPPSHRRRRRVPGRRHGRVNRRNRHQIGGSTRGITCPRWYPSLGYRRRGERAYSRPTSACTNRSDITRSAGHFLTICTAELWRLSQFPERRFLYVGRRGNGRW